MLAIRKETLKVVNPDTGNYEGIAAISGDKGESSYEVAKRNGYSGTEAEFLEEFVPDNILTSFESFKADNENVKNRLTSLETTVASLDVPDTSEDVAALQTDVSGLKSRMTSVESVNSSQGTSITNLTSRMSTAETKLNKIPATLFTVANNAAAHNSIYRGEDLTNKYTIEEICQMISAGTFDDLFIGDYINATLDGGEITKLVFSDFDGNLIKISDHHAILMPADPFSTVLTVNETSTYSRTSLHTKSLAYNLLSEYDTKISSVIPNTNILQGFRIPEPEDLFCNSEYTIGAYSSNNGSGSVVMSYLKHYSFAMLSPNSESVYRFKHNSPFNIFIHDNNFIKNTNLTYNYLVSNGCCYADISNSNSGKTPCVRTIAYNQDNGMSLISVSSTKPANVVIRPYIIIG